MPAIHPTAVIDPAAELHPSASVGPYCVITGPARLAAGARLLSHVTLHGRVRIGERTTVYPHAAIGFPAQDYKIGPDDPNAGVSIGADCLIREYASVHAATNEQTPTTVGDRVFMMTSSHAGHDCVVGDDAVLISGVLLAGHVTIGERATLGGGAMVHQHCRVGRLAMISGNVAISNDLPPFCTAFMSNRIGGVNRIGLRRNGFEPAEIDAVKKAVGSYFRSDLQRADLLEKLAALGETSPAVREMHAFVLAAKRPICAGGNKKPRGGVRRTPHAHGAAAAPESPADA